MMPCSSGNSPTIAVSRSHLQSSAARRARVTGSGTRACAPPCAAAISAASVATRRALSPSEPSFAWKVTLASPSARAASGDLRSCSQKNAASASRGRTTRSIALDDFRRLAALDVGHRDEARQQLPVGALHRKVALMVLQRRDQHLSRQRQEALLEAAGERHRPFHQRRDLIEQRVAHQRPAAELRRNGGDALAHERRAALRSPRSRSRARAKGARTPPGSTAGSAWAHGSDVRG